MAASIVDGHLSIYSRCDNSSPLDIFTQRDEFEFGRPVAVLIEANEWYVGSHRPLATLNCQHSSIASASQQQLEKSRPTKTRGKHRILISHLHSFQTEVIQCPFQTISSRIARLLFSLRIRLRCLKQQRGRNLSTQSSNQIHNTSVAHTYPRP